MKIRELAVRYRGQVSRGHNPRWSYKPGSGEGAARHGGRFNRKCIEALYTSESPTAALFEIQQGFLFKPQPVTICYYDVDCEAVLDLTDPKILAATSFTHSDLSCAWELMLSNKETPPSWDLSDYLIEKDISGIIVPSYVQGVPVASKNVVFWKWGEERPYKVKPIDENGRLPKNQKSWK